MSNLTQEKQVNKNTRLTEPIAICQPPNQTQSLSRVVSYLQGRKPCFIRGPDTFFKSHKRYSFRFAPTSVFHILFSSKLELGHVHASFLLENINSDVLRSQWRWKNANLKAAPYRKELRDFHSFQKQKSCWKISNIDSSHPFRWSWIFSEGTGSVEGAHCQGLLLATTGRGSPVVLWRLDPVSAWHVANKFLEIWEIWNQDSISSTYCFIQPQAVLFCQSSLPLPLPSPSPESPQLGSIAAVQDIFENLSTDEIRLFCFF